MMMDTQFAKFLQIGIIVEDIEETIKHYEEYGVGGHHGFLQYLGI